MTYSKQGRIVFKEGENTWIARPEELGLYLDPKTSASVAHHTGRTGNPLTRFSQQFQSWYEGKDLAPLLVLDQRVAQAYLSKIAAQMDKPTVEASISVNGTEVSVAPGQVGRSVDIPATLAPLEKQLRSLKDGIVPLVIVETPPGILDASQQAEIARNILKAPLELNVPDAQEGDPGPWVFDRKIPGRAADH